jgi:hypothetical protein
MARSDQTANKLSAGRFALYSSDSNLGPPGSLSSDGVGRVGARPVKQGFDAEAGCCWRSWVGRRNPKPDASDAVPPWESKEFQPPMHADARRWTDRNQPPTCSVMGRYRGSLKRYSPSACIGVHRRLNLFSAWLPTNRVQDKSERLFGASPERSSQYRVKRHAVPFRALQWSSQPSCYSLADLLAELPARCRGNMACPSVRRSTTTSVRHDIPRPRVAPEHDNWRGAKRIRRSACHR